MGMNIRKKKKPAGIYLRLKSWQRKTLGAGAKIIRACTSIDRKEIIRSCRNMNAAAKRKLAAAFALAVMAIAAASYWTGKSTEKAFRESMEEMAQYGATVTVLDYQRGIFGATAHTEWVLARSEQEPLILSFSHNIWHGPLLTLPSTASIRSELMPSATLTALFADILGGDPFGNKIPLAVKSTFGWFGGNHTRIVSPKFKATTRKGQTQLSWGGLDARIAMNSDRSKIETKIVMGGLSMTEDNEDQFQMGRATFKSNTAKIGGHALIFAGTSSLALNNLSFHGTDKETGAARAYAFENVHSKANTTFKDGGLDIKIRFDANTLVMGEASEAIVKPGATFLYENIDARALEVILGAALGQNEQSTAHALEEQADVLMRRKPALSITEASANCPEGMAVGSFRLAYTGDGDLDQFELSDLAAALKLNLPIALITRLLEEQSAQGQAEKTNKQVTTINSMIDRGAMTGEDGVLSVDASLENGSLIMNDQQEPLETLQELLEFF